MFVVVDDAGLKDMYEEGFEHFLPWMFCVLVEETDGQPEVFEAASVSLPLEELPAASPDGDSGATEALESGDTEGRRHTYTNDPVDSTDDECGFAVSHYDPVFEDSTSG